MLAWDFRSWEVFRPPWRNCQAANAGLGRDGRVASRGRPVPHRPGGAAAFAVDAGEELVFGELGGGGGGHGFVVFGVVGVLGGEMRGIPVQNASRGALAREEEQCGVSRGALAKLPEQRGACREGLARRLWAERCNWKWWAR